jgi:group I intron endonuclease
MCTPLWTGPAPSVPRSVLDLENVIYKFTSPSGTAYVGQTVRFEQRIKKYPALRKKDIGPAFYNPLKKHGFENFELSILGVYASKSLLDRAEILAIWKEGTLKPGGYNLNAGGGNATPTDESRAKMAETARNRSVEVRKKMSEAAKRRWAAMTAEEREECVAKFPKRFGADNHFFGKKHSEETRKKISEVQLGEKNHWRGKPKSMDWKLKFKASNKRIPCDVDLPLYVSLLQDKKRDKIVVRVKKPGHGFKQFGSTELSLSERIKQAVAYLETLS